MIMADQLKVASLPWHGNEVVRAPALSKLAEKSVVFRQAFTPYPLCVPARAALFSGQYPHNIGSRYNSSLLPEGTPHLVQALAQSGYVTALCGKNHCFSAKDLGAFDFCHEVGHQGTAGSLLYEFLSDGRFGAPCGAVAHSMGAAWSASSLVTDAAITFIRNAQKDRPFFLWASYPDPHPPFQAPHEYVDLYSRDCIELPKSFREDLSSKPRRQQIARRMFGMDSATEEQMRWTTMVYYAMVTSLDHQVGRLLAELEVSGRSDNTIVMFTSDHGEYMGEHGLVRKSNAFYDCLVVLCVCHCF